MAQVFDYDDPEGSKLTEADKRKLRRLIKKFQALLPEITQPIQPNVYTLTEVCINLLETQLDTEMHFEYAVPNEDEVEPEQIKKIVKEVKKERAPKNPPLITETPSVDDLSEWFEIESDEDE